MSEPTRNSEARRSGRVIRLMCPTQQVFVSPVRNTVDCSAGPRNGGAEGAASMISSTTSFSQNFPVTRTSSTSAQIRAKADSMCQTENSPPPVQRQVIIQRCHSAQVELDEPNSTPEPAPLPVDEVRNFVLLQLPNMPNVSPQLGLIGRLQEGG
ncbi:unnamed protein product [Echinostoma caproni]|uniref:Uncharacterized protein n=1 Tax=Echinostoma caproni TaxID=27848 RepID=A0A183A6X1_9TREM|nr:unnamed protein product [Echinostoma caproni]